MVMVASAGKRKRGDDRETMNVEERRTRAIEDIADSLVGMRGALTDISIWMAHIGRNMPTGRKN